MEEYEQKENEHYIEFIKRITLLREQYGLSYEEWCNIISKGNAQYSNDTARKAYYVLEKILPLIDYDCEVSEEQKKKFYDLHSKEVQIMKEREKQKDERKAYTTQVRMEARWEHLLETIANGLDEFDTSKFLNDYNIKYDNDEDNEAVLMISDTHIGMTIDNKLNRYNKEICIERFNNLAKQTLINCKRNGVKRLNVVLGGDLIEGIINTSGRIQQNENVVEQVFTASELLTELLI